MNKKHMILIAGIVVGYWAASSGNSLSKIFLFPDNAVGGKISDSLGDGLTGAAIGGLYGWAIAKYAL